MFTAEQIEALQQAFDTYKTTGEPVEGVKLKDCSNHCPNSLNSTWEVFCIAKGIDFRTTEGIPGFVEAMIKLKKDTIEYELGKEGGKLLRYDSITFHWDDESKTYFFDVHLTVDKAPSQLINQ